ncbi:hypothetical protein C8Q70DRAFT_710591 [Cubamyces menziesii]|nr:hypothetical protein C8Q70DRAFT_710591 [Cubamyces menziesii]
MRWASAGFAHGRHAPGASWSHRSSVTVKEPERVRTALRALRTPHAAGTFQPEHGLEPEHIAPHRAGAPDNSRRYPFHHEPCLAYDKKHGVPRGICWHMVILARAAAKATEGHLLPSTASSIARVKSQEARSRWIASRTRIRDLGNSGTRSGLRRGVPFARPPSPVARRSPSVCQLPYARAIQRLRERCRLDPGLEFGGVWFVVVRASCAASPPHGLVLRPHRGVR